MHQSDVPGFGEGAVRMAQEQEILGRVLLTLLLSHKYFSSSHQNKLPC